MKKTIGLVLVFFSLAWLSYGQGESMRFGRISVNDGLSQSSVNAVLKDSRGFMWFGTQDGLNRYDGYEFVVYQRKGDDSLSLRDGFILSLLEDPEEHLWIGSSTGGLMRFDPKFRTFTSLFSKEFPNDLKIPCLSMGSDSTILIGTEGHGLWKYDPRKEKLQQLFPGWTENITYLLLDSKDALWIGTESGLYVANPSLDNMLHKPGENNFFSDFITTIYEDRKGSIWVGTQNNGLLHYNLDHQLLGQKGTRDGLSSNRIEGIHEDEHGHLWLGTFGKGLCLYHPKSDRVLVQQHHKNNPSSLGNDFVNDIVGTDDGIIWIATMGGGLSTFDPKNARFELIQKTNDPSTGLNDESILSMAEDSDGNLWIGTQNGGLNYYDKAKKRYSYYPHEPSNIHSVANNSIRTLYLDEANQKLYAGTEGSGISIMNLKTKRFKHVQHKPEDPVSSPADNIRSITPSRHGHLWVSTFGGGLFKYFPDENRFERALDSENKLNLDFIIAVHENHDEHIWIATFGEGLVKYNLKTGACKQFKRVEKRNSLSQNDIISIFEDSSGLFWLATRAGLNIFNPEEEDFRVFTAKDGLANDFIYHIAEKPEGVFWISTNEGISRFNQATENFTNYNVRDGLQSNEFNLGAYLVSNSGKIYFGGINGLNSFYPTDISINQRVPPLAFTNFLLFNQVILPGAEDFLPIDLNFSESISLASDYTFFSIEFTALNYTNSTKNRYSYKLEGFDRDWIFNGHKRSASYTNLDPGIYTFRVKASNNDGVWNEEGISLVIKILPPFYATLWFRLLSAGLILLIAVFWYKNRVSSLKKQQIRLETLVNERTAEISRQKTEILQKNNSLIELNEEKNNVLSIVAHDLKAPINNIKGFANLIMLTDQGLSDEQKDYVDRILISSQRMTSLITNLLDLDAFEQNKIEIKRNVVHAGNLSQELIRDHKNHASKKNILIEYSDEADNQEVIADPNLLSQVIDNLLSNAIKFSPHGKKIQVKLVSDDNALQLKIKDQGPGISLEDQNKLFGKFQKLSAKPTGGENSNGLGLSIVKKFVEAMNGSVWCESTLGKGSTFIVELPLSKAGNKAEKV